MCSASVPRCARTRGLRKENAAGKGQFCKAQRNLAHDESADGRHRPASPVSPGPKAAACTCAHEGAARRAALPAPGARAASHSGPILAVGGGQARSGAGRRCPRTFATVLGPPLRPVGPRTFACLDARRPWRCGGHPGTSLDSRPRAEGERLGGDGGRARRPSTCTSSASQPLRRPIRLAVVVPHFAQAHPTSSAA